MQEYQSVFENNFLPGRSCLVRDLAGQTIPAPAKPDADSLNKKSRVVTTLLEFKCKLIILSLTFKIGLRMSTCRTDIRCTFTFVDVSAVTAFPAQRCIAFESTFIFQVF